MNCEILDMIYVRANGEFACNCDSGEVVGLGWLTGNGDWRITDVLENDRFNAIRQSFSAGQLPWGHVCEECAFLRRTEPFRDHLRAKQITKVLVEPTLVCALRCPGCNRLQQSTYRTGPRYLPLAWFDRLLTQLAEDQYRLGYFVLAGEGEPLHHPELPRLIDAMRRHFPSVPIWAVTHGNHDYHRVMQGRTFDHLIVSVDGVYQASYEQYRIHGDVAAALQFMSAAKRAGTPHVEWKYILFCHNDSGNELVAAQKKAEELGVDSVNFVRTHSIEHSLRYHGEAIARLPPLVSPLAWFDETPHVKRLRNDLNLRLRRVSSAQPSPEEQTRGIQGCLDDCSLSGDQLSIVGWALLDGHPPADIFVKVGGEVPRRARCGLPRPDVAAAFGRSAEPEFYPGFQFLGTTVARDGAFDVRVRLLANGERPRAWSMRRPRAWSVSYERLSVLPATTTVS